MPRPSHPSLDSAIPPAPPSETHRVARRDAWVEEPGTEAAARLREVIASAPVGLFAMDRGGVFTLFDGFGPAAVGSEPGDVVGRSALELYDRVEANDDQDRPLSGADAIRRALAGQEFVGRCRIGEAVLDFRLMPQRDEATGEVRGVVGVAVDVTRRTQMEEHLRDAHERLLVADRLASIGTLAAGAAHEINNPLTYALINLEHVLRLLRSACAAGRTLAIDHDEAETDRLPALVRALEQVLDGMQRVRGIARNLLTFSHGALETRTLVDLRGVVESSIQMAMHELVHRARVVRDFGEVPPLEANEAALGQVFLNLLVNAAQAIPESGSASRHEVRVAMGTDDEGNAFVEVRDTGVGIPPEILPRIFDPFFTSKASGQGLGLSISHATITSLGGRIEVTSEVGKGTSFHVVLPPSKRWRSSSHLSTRPPVAIEKRRVLVIEDDRPVGEAIARVLQDEAEVEVLTDARAAIARMEAGERWDLVFCDLMMPDASGVDVYAAAVERAPDVVGRIVFLTAGAFTPRTRAFVEGVANACLEKPLDAEQIREIVRRGPPARRDRGGSP